MATKRNKRNRLHRPRPLAQPSAVSVPLSDQYLNQGENLLAKCQEPLPDDATPEQIAQRQQALSTAIGTTLQGFALSDIERAQGALQQGRLDADTCQQQIDTALDEFNRASVPPVPDGSASAQFVRGLDGELIWLGE
ncbi:hypothetical protein GCM10028807_51780 [Spirosoma daeguense]